MAAACPLSTVAESAFLSAKDNISGARILGSGGGPHGGSYSASGSGGNHKDHTSSSSASHASSSRLAQLDASSDLEVGGSSTARVGAKH